MFDYPHIAVILPERLGDALFHTPSLRLLKTQRPMLKLDVIALSPLCAALLQNNPYIDAIHIAPDKRTAKNYDAALVLHNHSVAREHAKWLGVEVLTVTRQPAPMHRSQNSLNFVCSLLGIDSAHIDNRYDLFPSDPNANRIDTLLREAGAAESDILVGCHIGCHSIAKRGIKLWRRLEHPKVWPLDNFIALERALRAIDSRFRMVLTGSKSEAGLGIQFKRAAPHAINLIDRTSVLDLAALMDRLTVFVSSDTGAMHVACARAVSLIALFGPTNPIVTGPHPMRDNFSVLQAETLAAISVEQVVADILNKPATRAKLASFQSQTVSSNNR